MDPFIGEIRIFGFNFEPRGWALCNGQLLSIAQNTALFSLLGTQYGGDGISTFGLPDLRGRFAMHFGSGPGLSPRTIGSKGGQEATNLQANQVPAHAHPFALAASSGLPTQVSPEGSVLAGGVGSAEARYATEAGDVAMATQNTANSTAPTQAVPVLSPYQVVNFCIALVGVYPSRN